MMKFSDGLPRNEVGGVGGESGRILSMAAKEGGK